MKPLSVRCSFHDTFLSTIATRHGDWVLAALLLLALILRIAGLTTQPLWYDETTLVAYAQMDLGEWLSQIASAENQTAYLAKAPLVIAALRGWVLLFGASESTLRLPFALMGTAALVPFYLVGRHLLGRRVALLAVGLMAIHPFQIYFSQQVSEYVVLLLLGLLSIHLWLPCALGEPRGPWRPWSVCAINLINLGVHPLGVFVPVIQLAFELVRCRAWRRWPVWQNTIPLLTFVLLALAYLSHGAFVHRALGWIPTLGVDTLIGAIRELSHGVLTHATLELDPVPPTLTLLMGLMLGLALLGTMNLARRRTDQPVLLLLATWLGLPVLCLILYSLLRDSIWMARYLMLALPAYLLLVARGLAWLAGRRLARAALVLLPLVVLFGDALWRHFQPARGTMRELAADLRRKQGEMDGLFITPDQVRLPLAYYLSGEVSAWLKRPIRLESWWLTTRMGRPITYRQRLYYRWLANRNRVWVVTIPDWRGDTVSVRIIEHIKQQFLVIFTKKYQFSGAELTLFRRR